MTVINRPNIAAEISAGSPDGDLLLNVHTEADSRVVSASGELDLASRNRIFVTSTSGSHPTTVIDLSGVTFMDCGGYGSIVAARVVIEQEGRRLTVRGQTGQAAHLIDLISTIERAPGTKRGSEGPVDHRHLPRHGAAWQDVSDGGG